MAVNDPQNQPGVWQGGPSQWIGGQLYGINPASRQWEPLNTDVNEQSAGVYTFGSGNPVTQGQDPTLFDKIAMTGIQLGAGAGLGYGAYGAIAGGGAAAAGGGGAAGADTAGAAGAGTDAFASGAGATGAAAAPAGGTAAGTAAGGAGMDLGGGLTLDEFGNVVSGGAAGAGADIGSGMSVDAYGNVVSGGAAGGGTDLASLAAKYGPAALRALPAILGGYGANKQAGALQGLQNQYTAYGAPSRGRYEASMTPGFDPNSIPGYSGAVDTASKSLLARLSATGGNPYGNPGGLIDANKQIISGTALPAIQAYQNQNANVGFGGTLNAAGSFGGQAIGAQGNVYNAVGAGINDVMNPPQTLAQQLQTLKQAGLYSPNSLS